MANYYVPQVDYQSRDFTSIRDDLVNLIPNFAPQWTSRDDTDFGIVLIDLFSYMGDMLSYYIDRAANEGFLATATQRETVLNLARIIGYTPKEPVSATITAKITNNGSVTATVAQNALFSTAAPDSNGNYINFEYLGNTFTLSAGASSPAVVLTEGTTVAYSQIAVSDGTPDQTYPIYDDNLIYATSVKVTVGGTLSNGVVTGGQVYTKVDNLIDYGPSDTKFSVYYDGNNILNIRFGDGVSGKIPPTNASIYVSYRKGYGSLGNVGAGAVSQFVSSGSGGSSVTTFTVSNSTEPTVYGTDPESMDSIRINAPKSLRTINRAVALSDYAAIAIQSSSKVKKAIAVADNYSSVVVYVMGDQWNNALTSDSGTYQDIKNGFVNKTPPGTTLTILDGNISTTGNGPWCAISVSVTALPTYKNSDVKTNCENSIKSQLLSFDNVTFNDVIYQSDIYKLLRSVDGVNDVKITGLERVLATGVTSTTANQAAYFYVNEVPNYDSTSINVTVTGGIS